MEERDLLFGTGMRDAHLTMDNNQEELIYNDS